MLLVTGYVLPVVLLAVAFFLVYRLVPNTHVSTTSALVGAVVAGLLWHLAGLAFTAFLAGSTRYATIYSGFAGVMVFLIWLYIAWLIVLIGAQVGYFHQYPRSYIETRAPHGALYREWIALAVVAEVTRRFLEGHRPARLAATAQRIDAPLAHLEPIVDDLVARGILLRVAAPEGLALAASPDRTSIVDVLDVVRDPAAIDTAAVAAASDPGAIALRRRDAVVRGALARTTLRDLVDAQKADPQKADGVTPLARSVAS